MNPADTQALAQAVRELAVGPEALSRPEIHAAVDRILDRVTEDAMRALYVERREIDSAMGESEK